VFLVINGTNYARNLASKLKRKKLTDKEPNSTLIEETTAQEEKTDENTVNSKSSWKRSVYSMEDLEQCVKLHLSDKLSQENLLNEATKHDSSLASELEKASVNRTRSDKSALLLASSSVAIATRQCGTFTAETRKSFKYLRGNALFVTSLERKSFDYLEGSLLNAIRAQLVITALSSKKANLFVEFMDRMKSSYAVSVPNEALTFITRQSMDAVPVTEQCFNGVAIEVRISL
jgi:hypothetical protein